MSRGPESRFQKHLRDTLDKRRPSVWYFKAHGSVFQAGIPDLLGCDESFGAFGWELKATDAGQVDWSEVSELQRHTLRQIARAGGNARVMFYHERLRVVLSPDIARTPPRGEAWSEERVLEFARGNWPTWEQAAPRDLLAYAKSRRARSAPDDRALDQPGVAWSVWANSEGWRIARVARGTPGLPLDLVMALGFGRRASPPGTARGG